MMITISANNRRVRHVEPNPSRGQGTDLQPQLIIQEEAKTTNSPSTSLEGDRYRAHHQASCSTRTMENQGSLSPMYIVRPIFNIYFDHTNNKTYVISTIKYPGLAKFRGRDIINDYKWPNSREKP